MPVLLTILTPDRTLVEGRECHEIELPGAGGTMGILEDHTPLVTPLGIGEVRLLGPDGSVTETIAVAGGLAEVTPETVAVTARAAEPADEIDVSRAEDSKRRAEQRLHRNREDVDEARAEASLARALNRLRIAQGSPAR
jgi:F-type H+-transporting ATPase subunit epsilon